MDLVIVESPTKARTLSRYLGGEFKVEASMGHIRDLPKSGMGIDIENGFKPKYQVLADKKKRVAELKALSKKAKNIYLATDPDREGEAIAYHVAVLLDGAGEMRRVTFHEITKSAIDHALANPGKVNMQLVDAQQARRVLDRLVGYTLSPVLFKKIRKGLSAGRVQSVAVRLIVDREREIEAFVPVEYWEIFVDLKAKDGKLRVQLVRKNGKTVKVGKAEESAPIVDDLKNAKYVVAGVETSTLKRSPYPPFTTSVLQQAAANLMGWSSKKTMSMAQALYERGYITYHRTDSTNLAAEAVSAAREYIKKELGDSYLPEKPRFYKTKSKSAQEAHEAIRPTDVTKTGESIAGDKITGTHQKLYELIRTRFLQSQMNDALFDKTVVLVKTEDGVYELQVAGKRLKFDGWLRLGKVTEDDLLPAVEEGEKLGLIKVDPMQKFTSPPARYTEAGLIKELEKRGIGRPSTYAPTISTIQDRNYVTKEEGKFSPTSIGVAVTDFLMKYFEKVMAYEFTAKMEDDLDAIAEGKVDWVKVIGDFWGPFEKKVEGVEEKGERVKIQAETTGEKCPTCKEGEVVIRTGRYGKFYSCSRYPECKYTAPIINYVKDAICPEDGGRVVAKKTRRGASFYGCENYPKCKWATWKLPKKS